jgi:hypothetical protein
MVLRLFSLLVAVMIAAPAAAELYPYETITVNGPNNVLDATANACDLVEGCYTQRGAKCSLEPNKTCDLQRVPKGRCAGGTTNVWPSGAGTCQGNSKVACIPNPPNQAATNGTFASIMCEHDTTTNPATPTGTGQCVMGAGPAPVCTSAVTGANNELLVCGGGANPRVARCSDGDPNAANGGYGTGLCAQLNTGATSETNCGPISRGSAFFTPVYQIENPPQFADLQRDPGSNGSGPSDANSGPIIDVRTTFATEVTDPNAFGVRNTQTFGRSYFADWAFSDKTNNGSNFNSLIIVYSCDPPPGYERNLPVSGSCTAGLVGNFCIKNSTCDTSAGAGDGVCGNTKFCYEAGVARDSFGVQWTRDLTGPEKTGVCPPDCAVDLDHHTYETEEIVRLGLVDTPTGVQVALESGEAGGRRSGEGDVMGVVPVTAVTWLGTPDIRCKIQETSPGSGVFLGRCSNSSATCDPAGPNTCGAGQCLRCDPDPFFDDQGLAALSQIGRTAGVQSGAVPIQAAVITPLFAIGTTGFAASEFRDHDVLGAFDNINMGPAVPANLGDPDPSPGINLETGTTGYTSGQALPFGGTAGATTTVNPENAGVVAAGQSFLRGWDTGPGPDGIMGCFGDNDGLNNAANACNDALGQAGAGNTGADDGTLTANLGAGVLPVSANRFKTRPPNYVVRRHFKNLGYPLGEASTTNTVANWTIRDLDIPPVFPDSIDVVVKTNGTNCPIVTRPDTGTVEAYCSCDKSNPVGDCDEDGVFNKIDNCPFWSTTNRTDSNGDGIGNECQCGDTSGPGNVADGSINLLDIFGVNDMILGNIPTTDLCDTNLDGACNLLDIFGVNDRILGVPARCIRFPEASPFHPGS